MRRLRLLQLLLCLVLWTRSSGESAMKTCLCNDVEKLRGLHPDRPCNECASGYYLSCTGGSYYAHHPTMCIYATHRDDFTHEAADHWYTNHGLHSSSFLAFAGSLEESYDISHFVWNSLKNGVEGNETYFWLGGKHKFYERTNQTFWLFEYRGYYDEVPRELLPDDAELEKAILENRTCLAGHTEKYMKLYPMHCDEKFPAVCYSYRQTAKHFCEQVAGKVWTLFQGKCFYVYSSNMKGRAGYKSYFQAQRECDEMNATIVTVTDDATFKRTLDLATGIEKIVDLDDGTWIGLQTFKGRSENATYYYINGTRLNYTSLPTCTWPDGSPCKARGRWEDGTPYDEAALAHFWAQKTNKTGEQPNEEPLKDDFPDDWKVPNKTWGCHYRKVDQTYADRCEDDRYQHCAQIFPGGIDDSDVCPGCDAYADKWNDRWYYYLQRGYICQRNADCETDPYRRKDEL